MSLDADVRATFTAEGAVPFTVDVSLSVPAGETLVVLGPSGSGKSLLLEALAGLHGHEGHVRLHDEAVTDRPPEQRGFGFVFQDYALFPHMTVRENVAFGLRYHDSDREPDELLSALGVADLAERSPETLSGGEKQRVALARALAVDPHALLLDEPLSALDAPTRASLRDDLADAISDVTAVYVTHDRTTARAIGDRVAVMHDGQLEQVGPPEDVFESPSSAFVARFTGANVVPATALASPPGDADDLLAIRPEHVRVGADTPAATGTVERVVREDAVFRVTVDLGDATLDAFVDTSPAPGEEVEVGLPREHLTRLRG